MEGCCRKDIFKRSCDGILLEAKAPPQGLARGPRRGGPLGACQAVCRKPFRLYLPQVQKYFQKTFKNSSKFKDFKDQKLFKELLKFHSKMSELTPEKLHQTIFIIYVVYTLYSVSTITTACMVLQNKIMQLHCFAELCICSALQNYANALHCRILIFYAYKVPTPYMVCK